MKGPAESGQICSVGRRKIAKKIAKNKRCYANTLRPRSRMLLKVMKSPFTVHADRNAVGGEHAGEGRASELRALVGIEDVRLAVGGGWGGGAPPPGSPLAGSPVTRNAEIDPGDNDPLPKMTQGVMTPSTPPSSPSTASLNGVESQGAGIATLIFRYFLRYFSS